MPTDHDDFGAGRTAIIRRPIRTSGARAAALDRAMTAARFDGLATEWWHYAAAGATAYPLSTSR